MSVEALLCCDACGHIITSGSTAGEARREARETRQAIRAAKKDLCSACAERMFPESTKETRAQ